VIKKKFVGWGVVLKTHQRVGKALIFNRRIYKMGKQKPWSNSAKHGSNSSS
jgi:hypothetical protein